ncbi:MULTISPECIES: IS200/IS605 family transposase [Companilactobacillus]|uniref:IS200/IS605 family transposase n=2 Tax=Companilactobacillus futsaii TaxID=938155 RepID=A0A5B7T0N5_9LACO|nr:MULTISPECIES: IS200/IS605 family transposase [Companilactobacillus]KRK95274.1 transposase [Companilactobacillus futsaii JCM 17355]QCX23892.1 IS200/IS605 family transposase [Companilactobacillus futsaii]
MDKIKNAIYADGYVYNFHFHLIWVTKYRNKTFTTPELRVELKETLSYICKLHDITIENMEVMEDYVHMLISFKPKNSPTNVVKALKGGSARIFLRNHPEIKRKQFWGGNLWSRSYYMSTLGDMSKEVVEKYINNQRTTKSKAGRPKKK